MGKLGRVTIIYRFRLSDRSRQQRKDQTTFTCKSKQQTPSHHHHRYMVMSTFSSLNFPGIPKIPDFNPTLQLTQKITRGKEQTANYRRLGERLSKKENVPVLCDTVPLGLFFPSLQSLFPTLLEFHPLSLHYCVTHIAWINLIILFLYMFEIP